MLCERGAQGRSRLALRLQPGVGCQPRTLPKTAHTRILAGGIQSFDRWSRRISARGALVLSTVSNVQMPRFARTCGLLLEDHPVCQRLEARRGGSSVLRRITALVDNPPICWHVRNYVESRCAANREDCQQVPLKSERGFRGDPSLQRVDRTILLPKSHDRSPVKCQVRGDFALGNVQVPPDLDLIKQVKQAAPQLSDLHAGECRLPQCVRL